MSQIIQLHKEILRNTFDTLQQNLIFSDPPHYWTHLASEYNRDYSIIKGLSRCSKYKLEDYKQTHGFTPLDEYITSLNPNEEKFGYLKSILTQEYHLKNKFQKAIELLKRAKEVIDEVNSDAQKLLITVSQSSDLSKLQKYKILS